MKVVMASLSFERGRFGYSVHAEPDKIFVLQREYAEETGEVVAIVGAFECGTTAKEVHKLFAFFEECMLTVVKYSEDSYDPNIITCCVLDDGEIMLNETSNTMSFVLNELFVQFGLDDEHEVETLMLDADGNEIVTSYQMAPEPEGDEEYKWYAGL